MRMLAHETSGPLDTKQRLHGIHLMVTHSSKCFGTTSAHVKTSGPVTGQKCLYKFKRGDHLPITLLGLHHMPILSFAHFASAPVAAEAVAS